MLVVGYVQLNNFFIRNLLHLKMYFFWLKTKLTLSQLISCFIFGAPQAFDLCEVINQEAVPMGSINNSTILHSIS